MEATTVILILSGCLLSAALITLRRRRRKGLSLYGPEGEDPAARIAALRAQSPSPEDRQACDLIERELKRVSLNFSLKTSIAPKKVYALATDLTRDIAAVYYPDQENPMLQASLADLLKLDERIVTRLNQKVEEFPLKSIKDVSIQKILAGKAFYDSRIKDKLAWIKKYKTVYSLGNNAWLAYNALNPWYWGRRLLYTSTREITFRYLLTWIVTIVGEEAMAVYGRRDINTRETAFERDLAFAVVDLALTLPDLSAATYTAVLEHVLNRARLSDTVRVSVLHALVSKKPHEGRDHTGDYTPAQARRFMAVLEQVAAVEGTPPEMLAKLAAIADRLAAHGQGSASPNEEPPAKAGKRTLPTSLFKGRRSS